MERIARLHSKEILRLLISHGSDVMSKDKTGATVLYRFVNLDFFQPFFRERVGGLIHIFYVILVHSRNNLYH